MFTTVLRVVVGFVFACLVAGLVKVMFVLPPQDLLALPETVRYQRLGDLGILTLAAATQTAVFAAPFALVAAAIGEWQSMRGPLYYALLGMLIAAGGFLALWAGEEFTAQSYYAMAAYIAAGFLGGFTYWLIAGRVAGDPVLDDDVIIPPIPAPSSPRPTPAAAAKPAAPVRPEPPRASPTPPPGSAAAAPARPTQPAPPPATPGPTPGVQRPASQPSSTPAVQPGSSTPVIPGPTKT